MISRKKNGPVRGRLLVQRRVDHTVTGWLASAAVDGRLWRHVELAIVDTDVQITVGLAPGQAATVGRSDITVAKWAYRYALPRQHRICRALLNTAAIDLRHASDRCSPMAKRALRSGANLI